MMVADYHQRKLYANLPIPKGRTAVARRKRAHKPTVSNQETDEDQEETPAKKRKRAPARKKATDKESATKESASEAEEKQA